MRLLIFLLCILILACDSSSLAFLIMCSAYRLNKQGDCRQPCPTPFSILNQSVVPYRVLTVASWPVYRFFRRQLRWSSIPISLRAFHNFMIHTVKGFSIANETEMDVFLKFPCFLYNPMKVGNLTSSSSFFSKPSLDIWKFLVCWSRACKILSTALLAWEMSVIVWWLAHSLVLPFLGTGMRINLFQSIFYTAFYRPFTLLGVDYSASTKIQVVVWCL